MGGFPVNWEKSDGYWQTIESILSGNIFIRYWINGKIGKID